MSTSTSIFSDDTKRIVAISLLITAVLVGLFIIFREKPRSPVTNVSQTGEIAAITPEYFTSISGQIISINAEKKSLTLDFPIVDTAGKQTAKRYTVNIDSATSLQSIDQTVSPALVTPIDFATYAVGDAISAISTANLAPLNEFTATSLIRLR